MIIAVVITIIISIVIFFFMRKYYNEISGDPSGTTPSGTTPKFSDWKDSLNYYTQMNTMKQYCHLKGYDYQAPDEKNEYGTCIYNEQTCKADSNPHWVMCQLDANSGSYLDSSGKPCNPSQLPYLEWHTDSSGNGRCLVSNFVPSFITNVCEAQGLGEWYQGSPNCDADGYCKINPDNIPTCKLTPKYCDNMGMDYSSSKNGIGDCTISEGQHIAEDIFGRTITRTVKRNAETMIRQCKHDVFSANCAKGVGTFITTPGQIAINTVDKEFSGFVDNMKLDCSGNIYSNMDTFVKCGESLFPQFYVGKQVVSFADGMLNGMLGWIPGVPSGLLTKAIGYVGKYGEIAIKALYHAGEDAVHAFEIAGDYTESALKNIGLGAPARLIAGALKNIVNYGIAMAKVIANVAQDAIHLFAEKIIPEVFHVFHSISEAFLHPLEFFKHVGKDIQQFITDPIGTLKNAFTEISKIGAKVFHEVRMVVNYLKGVASKLFSTIGKKLMDIVNHIEKVFSNVGKSIDHAFKSIGHFLGF